VSCIEVEECADAADESGARPQWRGSNETNARRRAHRRTTNDIEHTTTTNEGSNQEKGEKGDQGGERMARIVAERRARGSGEELKSRINDDAQSMLQVDQCTE
jgi:hypothetical protein